MSVSFSPKIIFDVILNKKVRYIYNLTKKENHSGRKFFNHLYNTYEITKKLFPSHQYLIDASLYHSVYGTCYYKFNSSVNREYIKELIGERAENLVYIFCNLDNRTNRILEGNFDFEIQRDLYILEYVNLLEQNKNFETIYHIKYNLSKFYSVHI